MRTSTRLSSWPDKFSTAATKVNTEMRPIVTPRSLRDRAPSIYNATELEQLRGTRARAAWWDELCKWQYAQETWDQLAFGLRAGAHPQICITTTPRPTRLLKAIMADPRTIVTRGSTFDNRSNLASSFFEALERKYAGTRLGRQEIEAEILADVSARNYRPGKKNSSKPVPPRADRVSVSY
jgi:phage terminase large subunit-like protein